MLLSSFSKCSIPVKCYLFKTYCSKVYFAPLRYNFTLTAMKTIKIAYNNSTRRLFFLPKHNSASEMCVNLIIMSFGELLRKYVYSFRSRLGASLKCIIDNIYSSNVLLHSDICAWWHSNLTVYVTIVTCNNFSVTHCFYIYLYLHVLNIIIYNFM